MTDGDTKFFDIHAGVHQGDTLAPFLFIVCLDYVLRTSVDVNNELRFTLNKSRSRRYPDADYADIALFANKTDDAEALTCP